jgi:hypothetical protein
LIDELSLGVSIMPEHMVMGGEISAFLHRAKGGADLHEMQDLIWTKVSYVLGDMYPSHEALSADQNLELQKRFFDHLWEQPLSAMITAIGDADQASDHFRELSKETNGQNQIYRDELMSYEGMYDNHATAAAVCPSEQTAPSRVVGNWAQRQPLGRVAARRVCVRRMAGCSTNGCSRLRR